MTDSTLKTALLSLSVENDNHWTKAGLPRVETLKFLTGDTSLTQEIVATEIPGFNREAARMPFETVVTPEPVISTFDPDSRELTLKEQLLVEQTKLEELHKSVDLLQNQCDKQIDVVNKLALKIEKEFGQENTQDAISKYLAGQRVVLQERAAKLKMIAESGLSLKDLAENLKSPIDASLARKR